MPKDMTRDLADLLFPSSVAVVGASAAPGKIGHVLFSNVASFPGPVYAVNPKYEQILGRPCVPTVANLPESVSLALVIVPPPDALRALDACGRKGIRNAVVITAGFREQGGKGIELERELARIASEHAMNVLGPNAFGLVSPRVGLNATFAPRSALPGKIAFVSQSGALCSAVLDWAWKRKLGFSHFVSLGNKAVLTETDFLAAFLQDSETTVIAAYLEGIEDGREFLRVAHEVTRSKPVVVLKAGRTEAGARAASSHTGALAGSDRAYDAAFRRCGVIRARTVEELFEQAAVLAGQPLPQETVAGRKSQVLGLPDLGLPDWSDGRRLGIVSNAGGPGIMAADAAAEEGLEVAGLSPATTNALVQRFSTAASVTNPVDILADASAERFRDAVDLVLGDPGVDMAVVLTAPHPILTFSELAVILANARRRHGKPVVASFMAGELGEEAEDVLREAGIPAYFEPARAVRALGTLAKYRDIRSRAQDESQPLDKDSRKTLSQVSSRKSQACDLGLGTSRLALGVEALELLAVYGIPVARGGLAKSPEEAARLARDLGERVVLKVVSPNIVHKSDLGGVRIGVLASEARKVYRELIELLPARSVGMQVEGVYVQELLPPGQEAIVGIVRDPTFGPLVMFGLGGVFVELLGDVAFAVAPVPSREAEELVRSIRGFPLLQGARGRPPVHLPSLVEAVEQIGRLAADFPEISELDVNPLLCYPDRVVAVDLRATLDSQTV